MAIPGWSIGVWQVRIKSFYLNEAPMIECPSRNLTNPYELSIISSAPRLSLKGA